MNNCKCITWGSTDVNRRLLSVNHHHENCELYIPLPEWCILCAEEIEGAKRHYPAVAKTARIIFSIYNDNKENKV